VAEILLQVDSLFLSMVNAFFDKKKVQERVGKHNINENLLVISRWILSNVIISLGDHLSCACKVKKHDTILYPSNGDILLASARLCTNKRIAGLRKILAYLPLLAS